VGYSKELHRAKQVSPLAISGLRVISSCAHYTRSATNWACRREPWGHHKERLNLSAVEIAEEGQGEKHTLTIKEIMRDKKPGSGRVAAGRLTLVKQTGIVGGITAIHHGKTGARRHLIQAILYAVAPDSDYVIGRPSLRIRYGF
jgi:hypothetical protein